MPDNTGWNILDMIPSSIKREGLNEFQHLKRFEIFTEKYLMNINAKLDKIMQKLNIQEDEEDVDKNG